ncbi:MAG TPA: NAD(P)H-dependent oxidoreductase [Chitinophagaceae bacterium]|nr:NAD(P)H-dependent oxidoreductase [Chitinophagaceae bacterium]
MNFIIIQGSARSDGNTNLIARILQEKLNAGFIDLKTKNINGYEYGHENMDDDFMSVIREIIKYDAVIFITPVYWYAMSGLMKNFFDRITDCLKVEKETGRKLRGKYLAAVSCSGDPDETEGFFVPFHNSAGYLGMHYLGDMHTWTDDDNTEVEPVVLERINAFVKQLKKERG